MALLSGTARAQQTGSVPVDAAPLDLSDARAVEERADLYMVRKYYPEAVELYQRLTTLDGRNAAYYNKLGIAYHQLLELGSAKKAYQKAVQLKPQYPEAINNLAAVQYAQKDYRGAILTYLKALEFSPGDAVIYSNLGTAYFAYKKFEYAMNSYRYALLRDPKVFERSGRSGNLVQQRNAADIGAFNFYLAKTYASMGDTEQTLLYLTKALEANYPDMRNDLSDPVFKFLTEEPRFLELIARLNPEQQRSSPP
jgi:Flp pilus assembly protein TadD